MFYTFVWYLPTYYVLSPIIQAPAAPAASGGGFFSFLQSSPGVGGTSAPPADVKPAMAMKSKAPTAAVATKEAPTVTGMNPRFLATISKLLKNDASKIKTFQKSTDAFRYGEITDTPKYLLLCVIAYTHSVIPSHVIIICFLLLIGDLTPVAFLSQLEKLFGEGQLEAVVIPLVSIILTPSPSSPHSHIHPPIPPSVHSRF